MREKYTQDVPPTENTSNPVTPVVTSVKLPFPLGASTYFVNSVDSLLLHVTPNTLWRGLHSLARGHAQQYWQASKCFDATMIWLFSTHLKFLDDFECGIWANSVSYKYLIRCCTV